MLRPILLSVALFSCRWSAEEPADLQVSPVPPASHSSGAAVSQPSAVAFGGLCPALLPADSYLAPWETREKSPCVESPVGSFLVEGESLAHYDPKGVFVWRLELAEAPVSLSLTSQGEIVALGYQALYLVSAAGKLHWKKGYSQTPSCGAPWGMSLGYDDSIWISCGYSLLRFDKEGGLLWQKWPNGNHTISTALLLKENIAIVSGGGYVAAVDEKGENLWQTGTGNNRYVHKMAQNKKGELIFMTSMAALHSPEMNGVRRYYKREPPELIVMDRSGKILSRGALPEGTSLWPEAVAPPRDGRHQLD